MENSLENQEKIVDEQTEINCGKFKSVDALLQAYTSLEAEFTRRSQKLKELESKVEHLQQATEEIASIPSVDLQNRTTVQTTLTTEKEEVLSKDIQNMITNTIQECLQKQMQQIAPPILKNIGGFAKAPAQKVATIEEAGKLAEAFFKNIK